MISNKAITTRTVMLENNDGDTVTTTTTLEH